MTVIITSLSPKHSNASQQQEAINSWQQYGTCYSMNNHEEIALLQTSNYEGVSYLPTNKTVEHYLGRPLVTISAMMDIARLQGRDLLIVNSDIVLEDLPEFKQDGITLFSRYDYDDIHGKINAKMFTYGFDAVYIPRPFLRYFPVSLFAMGAPWWDLAIPFHAIRKSIKIYYPEGKYAFHKVHNIHYSIEEWNYLSEWFKLEFKLEPKLSGSQVATQTMNLIRSKINLKSAKINS